MQLTPEEHIAGRVDVVGQGELLIDHLDPMHSRFTRVVDADELAFDEDLARVGRVGP